MSFLGKISGYYNLFLSPDKNFARALKDLLGFAPRRLEYYRRAFSHKSYGSDSNSNQSGGYNNERLEYLGDAVLGTVIAEYLFMKYPNKDEGFMTMMRSKIVNRKTLGELAARLDIDTFMRQQGGEVLSETMMGNAFEALVGAVYLDVGYYVTRRFIIRRIIKGYFDVHHLENVNTNYKSQLLEYCQKNHRALDYQVVAQFKQNRRDKFRVAVTIDGKIVAEGEDYNKKSAEQIASENAMKGLGLLKKEEAK